MVELQEDLEGANSVPSIKELALIHIRKISDICCQEFKPGYWDDRPVKTGSGISLSKTYHPDTREVFCNAIRFLCWIVGAYASDESSLGKLMKENAKFLEEYTIQDKDIEKNMSLCFKLFKEMNIFFNNEEFFDSSIYQNEGGS